MEKARERRRKNERKNTGKWEKGTLENSVFVRENKSVIRASFQSVESGFLRPWLYSKK